MEDLKTRENLFLLLWFSCFNIYLTCCSRWNFPCKIRPWLACKVPSGRRRKRSARWRKQWPSRKTTFMMEKWIAGGSTTPSRSSRWMAAHGSTQLHGEPPGALRASIFICSILYLQGNIRVFCRVRPLVEGGLSRHIQLPAADNKLITLAKTEEVRNFWACQIPQRWEENGAAENLQKFTKPTECFFSLTQAKPPTRRRTTISVLTVSLVLLPHSKRWTVIQF